LRENERYGIIEAMFARKTYFNNIDTENADSTVRLLTGIRRSGKSSLLMQAMESLRVSGVDDAHIIYHDFENFVLPEIKNNAELRRHIESLLKKDGKYYLFLDEIQAISGWEKTLSAFQSKQRLEFFIASSGNRLKILKTKKRFGEKWTEIKINPLSYAEYRKANRKILAPPDKSRGLLRRAMLLKNANHETFNRYVERGGFPGVLKCGATETAAELNNIYTSILFHDVIVRQKIKNGELLERIIKFIFENIGGECSAGQLVKYFKGKHYTKNLSSVRAYIKALEEAFIVKRVRRLNLKTYRPLNAYSKYYVGDHALVFALSDSGNPRLRGIFENILVNELERRYYEIYWGKYGNAIVEFVGAKEKKAVFIQTTDVLKDDDNAIRNKLTALINIPPPGNNVCQLKFFIFLNAASGGLEGLERNESEIKCLSLPDFLLCADY
jgi:predicted AAA+ superfamily ATPase